ncbi:MAG TPA: 6-carboxyhexanoate--CoA ligase [Geothermobacteraceae bacterium]|nr:6-carboxyhexanoate--CoA ligase [Geothermobacteraceae bacterium]
MIDLLTSCARRLTSLGRDANFPLMEEHLYSIRMHASASGKHVSGAENLVRADELSELAANLVRRALQHSRGPADQIRVSIDLVEATRLANGRLPPMRTLEADSVADSRQAALLLLERAGVTREAATAAMRQLTDGAAPGGGSMRGAMLNDSQTGQRLEPDPARGIRVSRTGLAAELAEQLSAQLAPLGLDNAHVREALVLAGKVAMHPDVVAELCWSDDPDYTAGYVCSRRLGYLRFPHLKPLGETRGGRAFFIRPGCNRDALMTWLETSPLLFNRAGEFFPPVSWRDYATGMDRGAG